MKERQEKLNQAGLVLKKEFVGIDSIIDQILENITPWYVTPEIITRPISISLWGLTGTGKTSVVKRLLDLLEVSGNSLYFNCATEAASSRDSLESKLESFFDEEDRGSGSVTTEDLENCVMTRDPRKSIIILDEFQNCRTVDEHGMEKDRSQTGVIWQLLDSGHVELINYSWERAKFLGSYEDISSLSDMHRNLPVKDGKFTMSSEELRKLDETIYQYLEFSGLLRPSEGLSLGGSCEDIETETPEGKDKDEKKTFPAILEYNCDRFLIKVLNLFRKGYGWEIKDKLKKATTLGEFCSYLKEAADIVSKPKILDFSRSLVFVIGNLDEAFGVGDGVDPDIDADILKKITSNVTITDVKNSLRKRFRLEQISRLGNNMVLYPSLGKEDFKKVIDLELTSISEKFKTLTGFTISFTDKMKTLIYSESVYPIQGVRPIHSTITSLITPKLSKIILNNPSEDCKSAVLDVLGDDFEKDSIELIIKYESGQSITITQELVLGSLRDISKYKKIHLHAVHEAGHSVVYSVLTGEMPETIVAISAQGGGYMWSSVEDKSENRQAKSVEEMEREVMISYAGALAEELIFVKTEEDRQKLSLGASSDIADAWDILSYSFYDCGYGSDFMKYRCVDAPQLGLSPCDTVEEGSRDEQLVALNDKLVAKTKLILSENIELLKEVARELGEKRKMTQSRYKEIYEKYHQEEKENIYEWYKSRLG